MSYRTHNCGQLTKKDIGKNVILSGWVQKSRRMGQKVFIDIRDKYGITQIVFDNNSPFVKLANDLRSEFVIRVEGKVIERKSKNSKMPTGDIEIIASNLVVLAQAKTTPLIIDDTTDALEDVRMKYRYLDIRRNPIRKNIELRHKVTKSIRDFLDNHDFTDVDTPIIDQSNNWGSKKLCCAIKNKSR